MTGPMLRLRASGLPPYPLADLGPCDPLVPALCAYPWPNDFWLREDASSATGYRLNVTAATMPADTQGRRFETDDWNTLDGFSASSAAHAFLGDVDLEPLPHHWVRARARQRERRRRGVRGAPRTLG